MRIFSKKFETVPPGQHCSFMSSRSITTGLDLVSQHSPDTKFCSQVNWEEKSISSEWGTVPLLNVSYLGCFLLALPKAEVTCWWRLPSCFLLAFSPEPQRKESVWRRQPVLSTNKRKVVFLIATTLLFQRNEDMPRRATVPLTCLSPAQHSDAHQLLLSLPPHLLNLHRRHCLD